MPTRNTHVTPYYTRVLNPLGYSWENVVRVTRIGTPYMRIFIRFEPADFFPFSSSLKKNKKKKLKR